MVIVVTPILRVLQGKPPFQRDYHHGHDCRRRHCQQCAAYAQNPQYYNGPTYPNIAQNFNPGPNYSGGANFNPGPNYNGSPNFNPNYNGGQNFNAPPSYNQYPTGQMSGSTTRDAEPSQSSRQVTATPYSDEKDPIRNTDSLYTGDSQHAHASASNARPENR